MPDSAAAHLRGRLGQQLACSDWITLDQARIDAFAHATGDHYWIHTDPGRARAEGRLGTTIAHGFLTLSLLAPSCLDALLGTLGGTEVLNYGMEALRFLAPVRCGERVRCAVALGEVNARPDGRFLLGLDCTVEIDGQDRPALVARALMLFTC
ncbi:MAG: MaoC family dehydratase [Pseudomonadota bacterium]